jgi:23S rRNA pseudouridine2605 synthase
VSDSEFVRVQKFISDAGIASRRGAEELIRNHEVTINGKTAQLGDKVIAGKDHVKVRGKLIVKTPKKVVIAFFKPRGVITTSTPGVNQDREQESVRDTIWEYFKPVREKIRPVGRLDSDTEGLLLLTNDGDLGDRLNKAKFEVPRQYLVKIDGHLEEKKVKRLLKGLLVEDVRVRALSVETGRMTEGKQWYKVVITDPRNRAIRKMFEAVGHPVDKVLRESVAGVTLRGLERGNWRYLSENEIEKLRGFVGLSAKTGKVLRK